MNPTSKPGRSRARRKVKNGRRANRRNGKLPRWLRGKPVLTKGAGGTDKSATRNNGRPPRYSPEPARR